MPTKTIDCIVCGSCVADLLCKPVPDDIPLGHKILHEIAPIQLIPGGLTANVSFALAKLGIKTSVFSFVGNDPFGSMLRQQFENKNIDTTALHVHPTAPTSTTAVLISEQGERTFLHAKGAPKSITIRDYYNRMSLFEQSKYFFWGYYGLNPQIESELPKLLEEIRSRGTKTVIDAAGSGGSIKPLDKILPHLDVYIPSHAEASNQTGHEDPEKIISTYRSLGAPGILGVKLGSDGAILADPSDNFYKIDAITPPDKVLDTTGAGDCFYAGLIAGLVDRLPLTDAGKLAAAAGACAVTSIGGSTGARARSFVNKLAGLQ